MDCQFSDEHRMLRETARRFVEQELQPIAQQIDQEQEVPRSLITKAGEIGLLGVPFPEPYGGSGLGETEEPLHFWFILAGFIGLAIFLVD